LKLGEQNETLQMHNMINYTIYLLCWMATGPVSFITAWSRSYAIFSSWRINNKKHSYRWECRSYCSFNCTGHTL